MPDSSRSKMTTSQSRRYAPLLKGGLFFLSLLAIIIFVRLFDLESIISRQWVDEHIRSRGVWGVCLFMALAAFLSPLGIPRQALAALGGYTFGALMGTVWTSMALVAGCALGFLYARFLAKAAVQKKFGKYIARLDAFIAYKPFTMSMTIRLFPFGNNALTSMAAGVTRVPLLPFALGSGFGYLPQTIIFALLGSGIRVEPMLRTVIAAALFVLSSFLGYYLYRKYRQSAAKAD